MQQLVGMFAVLGKGEESREVHLLPTATATDVDRNGATVAVLPIGSFEQHGSHHPLITDTVVASAIADRIARDYALFLLPPVTVSCSHEHSGFAGSVSMSAQTLMAVVRDIAKSLELTGIRTLVLVNGHGGNYVLQNVVQEANVAERRMTLFPTRDDWLDARRHAQLDSDAHDDMHAGELETSILLSVAPNLLRDGYESVDWKATDRRHILITGISEYTHSGVVGAPSLGSAVKGERILDALSTSFKHHLRLLLDQ